MAGYDGNFGIVMNGLVMCIDTANVMSYAGTDTNVSSIYGNIRNYTLTNGPVFSGENGGIITFDGTNDYAQSVNIPAISGLTGNNSTLSIWLYGSFNGSSQIVYYDKLNFQSLGFFYTRYFIATCGDTINDRNRRMIDVLGKFINNRWNNVVITYDSTMTPTGYVNGALITSYSTVDQWWVEQFDSRIGNRISPGNGYDTGQFPGKIGQILSYNRVLTQQEITQNFNAIRLRYNI